MAFIVLDYSTLFVLTWHILGGMVRVIEGKTIIYRKWPEGKRKLLRVSGRFEFSRVRVTEGKIAVNV